MPDDVCVCVCVFTRLVLRAYQKGLVEGEVFDLNPRDKSATFCPVFQSTWEKAMHRANFLNRWA